MNTVKEKGFAHAYIIIGVVVVLIGLAGWHIMSAQQDKKNSQAQNQQTKESSPIAKLSLQEQEELKAEDGDIPPTAESTPRVATTQTTPSKPVNNATSGATAQKTTAPAAAATTPASTPTSSPAAQPAVLRPTAEFCAQKNGNSFTNVWFTGTASYTYDGYEWENGYSYSAPRVSKTESGTPLRNYDSMQLFDVAAYGTQPKWAACSDKAGYVMVYYSVPGSPYTFNVLAEYGHLSLEQP